MPKRALDRQTAWACLLSNVVVPGSGTLLAGRAVGYAQLAITLVSLAFTTLFGLRFIAWFFMNWQRLQAQIDPFARLEETWFAVRWALVGIALFAFVWVWSMVTSLYVFYLAHRSPPIHPPAIPDVRESRKENST